MFTWAFIQTNITNFLVHTTTSVQKWQRKRPSDIRVCKVGLSNLLSKIWWFCGPSLGGPVCIAPRCLSLSCLALSRERYIYQASAQSAHSSRLTNVWACSFKLPRGSPATVFPRTAYIGRLWVLASRDFWSRYSDQSVSLCESVCKYVSK